MPPCHGPAPAARMLGVSRGLHGGRGRRGRGLLSGGSRASWEGPRATAVHTTALEPHDGSNKIRGPRLLIPQALLSTCRVPSTAGGAGGGYKTRGRNWRDIYRRRGAEVLGCRTLVPGWDGCGQRLRVSGWSRELAGPTRPCSSRLPTRRPT